jgi:UDP:flavonoid glycosyltransferase YjiC (YdhE family)
MWTKGFAGPLAGRIASDVLRLSERWRPDLLIHEDTELGSWIAAERLGIPQVDLQVTAWRPGMHRVVVEPLARLREAHGLAPDPTLEGLFGDIFLSTRPPLLQAPEGTLPGHAVPMRPVVLDDVVDADDPAWLHDRQAGRPRVGVTLGTANAGRLDLIRSILEGLAGLGCEVVVTVGEDGDPEVLADAGPNVRVVRYLAMSRLLPTCDALVFHGGSGTMLAALSVGLPLVIVPISADQPDNAARCQAAGVARVVAEATLTAMAVREAIAAVLGDAGYRSRATAVAAQIAAMPWPTDILPTLEALVSERTTA